MKASGAKIDLPYNPFSITIAHCKAIWKASHGDGKGAAETAGSMVAGIPASILLAGTGVCMAVTGGFLASYLAKELVGGVIESFDLSSVKYTYTITNHTGMFLRLQDLQKWNGNTIKTFTNTPTRKCVFGVVQTDNLVLRGSWTEVPKRRRLAIPHWRYDCSSACRARIP